MRTLGAIDVSLHAALLGHVALVGGGSMAAGFALQLERRLSDALAPAPWRPRLSPHPVGAAP